MNAYIYKIETHCHTSEISPCSHITASELIYFYKKKGYDGMCITNHFSEHALRNCSNADEAVSFFLSCCRRTENEGKKLGIKVYTGAEVKLARSPDDYLIFDFDASLLYDLYDMLAVCTREEFSSFVRSRGGLVFQAHPFRDYMTVSAPEYVDGIEVFNGHPGHKSRNEKALEYAEKYHLSMIGGSDAHELNGIGIGGIYSKYLPENTEDYFSLIRSHDYVIFGGSGINA